MWLMISVLALPLIEIALFVVVGGAIGLWATLAWVVLSAVLGVLILKRVARMGAISFDRDVKALRDPMSPIAGRALTILAAGLLILPGFFTDTMGLLLLMPPVQTLLVNMFARRLRQSGAMHQASMTIEGDWAEVAPERPDDQAGPSSAQPPSGWTRH
jgi:UPF0716 protein FxsA